jgi:histidine ammonia-lyase
MLTPADSQPAVLLDGRSLDADMVVRLAEGSVIARVPDDALARVEHSWHTARELVSAGRVYGRSTGVGVKRTEDVAAHDADGHDLRLLLSHAGGIGAPLPARQTRAMMAVRANQLLAGGSGLRPAMVLALVEALRTGVHPVVNEYGSVGTGDLTALAQTGLALVGLQPWQGGDGEAPAPLTLERGDALALISSNALVLGQTALVCHDLGLLLRASDTVTALALAAAQGSLEPYAGPVHEARPHPGSALAAAEVRRLLGAPERPAAPTGRVQDPFGFRCFPQAHGPALEACAALQRLLSVELNSAAENPLISREGPAGGPAAYHHGGFFAAPLALALDHLCLAVLQTARLSVARLSGLGHPEITGLTPYLAETTSASSGMMILEYSANGALAEIHACAAPASLGHVVLSQGVEEAATFASQAARKTLRAVDAYRLVLACELVAAVRALRQRGTVPDTELPVGAAFSLAAGALERDMADRPLTGDVAAAAMLMDQLAAL